MGEQNIIATCHVEDCAWWQKEHCIAPMVKVAKTENHADCMTYETKEGEL